MISARGVSRGITGPSGMFGETNKCIDKKSEKNEMINIPGGLLLIYRLGSACILISPVTVNKLKFRRNVFDVRNELNVYFSIGWRTVVLVAWHHVVNVYAVCCATIPRTKTAGSIKTVHTAHRIAIGTAIKHRGALLLYLFFIIFLPWRKSKSVRQHAAQKSDRIHHWYEKPECAIFY